MGNVVNICGLTGSKFLASRIAGKMVRKQIEARLLADEQVRVGFENIYATQSFIDEMLGHLILARGPDVLERLIFTGCSDQIRRLVQFVADSRSAQYRELAIAARAPAPGFDNRSDHLIVA